MRVQFANCLFDSDTRELFRAGAPAHISPKAFRVLELLLEARPRALSKDELHRKVWPNTFVSEATLASAIAEIRSAIGDGGGKPRCLRTVHGFGYAFSGQATDSRASTPAGGVSQFLLWEDQEIPLGSGENLLGRGEDVGVRINDSSVSRHHARISIREASATLEDLGSKNGTFVGASRISQPTVLTDGDEIRLGEVAMTFRLIAAGDSTETIEDRRPITRHDSVPAAKSQEKIASRKR